MSLSLFPSLFFPSHSLNTVLSISISLDLLGGASEWLTLTLSGGCKQVKGRRLRIFTYTHTHTERERERQKERKGEGTRESVEDRR